MLRIPIPEEEININDQKIYWSSKRIARMAIFIAMCAVGSMIKVPSPTGTVALDAAFAFFSAIAFGWKEGAIVAALGHMLTALTTGFPLGLPMHLFIALQMSAWVSIFSITAKKIHLWFGVFLAVVLNGPVSSLLVIPIGGVGLFAALIVPLTIGGFINVFIATTAYLIIQKSKLI
ncbi:MAG: ECF transporter S component [Melioribacteraceae bacterium]|nr:ECF transporter S component [Melioribacteraceae bacterium]